MTPHLTFRRALALVFAVLFPSLLLPAGRARAGEPASSVVTTAADVANSNDNVTSLREAIKHVLDGKVAGPVTFDATVFAHPTTITLDSVNNPSILIGTDLEIDGSAAGVTISGGDTVTVFTILGVQGHTPHVTLKNLTIAHGHGPLAGGIVAQDQNGGNSPPNITLNGCTFSDNVSDAQGGAIYSEGAVVSAENCTFSRNLADPNGRNLGHGGGAIYNTEPFSNKQNSVFLDHCTIAFNSTGGSGGGIRNESPGLLIFSNTIIGDNTAGISGPDVSGGIVDDGFNIVSSTQGATFEHIGLDDSHLDVDPRLVPTGLANNGGPTQTIALQGNSPAIDGGHASILTTDQRGQPRLVDNPLYGNPEDGDGTDIGAFEVSLPTIVNNFGNNADEVSDVIGSQGIAQAFTTDNQVYRLNSVNPVLAAPGGGTEEVELQLRANNESTHLPGAIIQTWSNVAVTGSTPQDIIQTSTTAVLSANTQYWLVVKAVSGGQVNWLETSGTANAGVGTLGKLVTAASVNATPAWKPAHNPGTTLLSVRATVAVPTVAVGRDSGSSQVAIFDGTASRVSSLFAAAPQFDGGVRVASADFDGDGVADTVTGIGPGGGSAVTVFGGSDGKAILSIDHAFVSTFLDGVYVAAGDVNGDGVPDIVVGNDGLGNLVRVFSGKNGAQLKSFHPFAASFHGAVRVAAADLNGDGFADIIVGEGPGDPAGSRVRVYSGKTDALLYDFVPYASSYQGGVFVACGDVYGTGHPAVITGQDAGGSGEVIILSGPYLLPFTKFTPSVRMPSSGVRVATADLNGDGIAEIVVGSGPDGNPAEVLVYSAADVDGPAEVRVQPFPGASTAGCFVAGAVLPQSATLPITVEGPGSGTVTGAKVAQPIKHMAGSTMEHGSIDVRFTETFKLKATPAPGSVFNGWVDQHGALASFEENATFRMAPGLELSAVFVPSPFPALAGTYQGTLVFDDGSSRGHLTAVIGTDGAVTLTVKVGMSTGLVTVNVPKDQILGTGEFDRIITVKGIGDMDLHFQLALLPTAGDFLSGTLTQVPLPGSDPGTGVSATFTAERQEFAAGDCPFAGNYTLILARGAFPPDDFPQGEGNLQVRVATNGSATFNGVLGDGTRMVASFRTSLSGACDFFCPLYAHKGFLAGTLNFRNANEADLDGALTWAKPPGEKGTYPAGFFGSLTARGVLYKPVAGQRLVFNPSGAGYIFIEAHALATTVGGKPVTFPEISELGEVTINDDDTIVLPDFSADGITALNCKLKRSNGTFKGTFQQTIGTAKRTFSYSGVITQQKGGNTGLCGAVFLRGPTTGSVLIF